MLAQDEEKVWCSGARVMAQDKEGDWWKGVVSAVGGSGGNKAGQVRVKFDGWGAKYDEWIAIASTRITSQRVTTQAGGVSEEGEISEKFEQKGTWKDRVVRVGEEYNAYIPSGEKLADCATDIEHKENEETRGGRHMEQEEEETNKMKSYWSGR